MTIKSCIVCSSDLIYQDRSELLECSICKMSYNSNAKCKNGHFVCDACHEMEGFDYIRQFCVNSKSSNPIELASLIMDNPKIKMHGPEHHFLVPAVLITSYYNKTGKQEFIHKKLEIAKERAKNILGGFCGFYGNCGAGVGTGIFMSIILNCTPLSKEERRQSNLITSQSLNVIALNGGPRCCKRDTYLSLETAIRFTYENLKVQLGSSEIVCKYIKKNKECIKRECKYYPHEKHGAQHWMQG